MEKVVFGFCGSDDVWIENINETVESYVVFAQLFSNEKTTTLKSMTMVAYPVHDILLNVC